ncbi:MAG: T9SS type A sorting domain-containing protein, partial [Flavobacteriales bacterium]|nr:T9SS type A sorting domain-containing protein [Flavobacteriales bacterium]
LFFTAITITGEASIGLARSLDGSTFFDTTQVVRIPRDIYPANDNFLGLSTPDATLVGDTIYLFTDIVRPDAFNEWNQIGLHQFKSYGDINKWYHDTLPIHIRSDFPWTDGNFNAAIWGINPLLDGNRLRIWYAGNNISSIDTSVFPNDTTNNVYFIGNELHVNAGFWGIGTSEYVFPNMTTVSEMSAGNKNITIHPNPTSGQLSISLEGAFTGSLRVLNSLGQVVFKDDFEAVTELNLSLDGPSGLYFIQLEIDGELITKKVVKE